MELIWQYRNPAATSAVSVAIVWYTLVSIDPTATDVESGLDSSEFTRLLCATPRALRIVGGKC